MSIAFQYNPHITLISDPKVLAIPIKDLQEPMIDIRTKGDIMIGPSPEIPDNTNYTFMRYTVYKKLKEAQTRLPSKYRFCLYEAYRSPELQKKLFEIHLTNIKNHYPNWSDDETFKEATKLFSPMTNPDGSQNIPPHSTGGAIDLYLVNMQGEPIDMGIHPKDWMQDIDGSLSLTGSTNISAEAVKNREIMFQALSSVGFVNYPTEYWHWSYGDKYWALLKHNHYAIYGTTSPSESFNEPKRIIDLEPNI